MIKGKELLLLTEHDTWYDSRHAPTTDNEEEYRAKDMIEEKHYGIEQPLP